MEGLVLLPEPTEYWDPTCPADLLWKVVGTEQQGKSSEPHASHPPAREGWAAWAETWMRHHSAKRRGQGEDLLQPVGSREEKAETRTTVLS
jgi:hypothetical protein